MQMIIWECPICETHSRITRNIFPIPEAVICNDCGNTVVPTIISTPYSPNRGQEETEMPTRYTAEGKSAA